MADIYSAVISDNEEQVAEILNSGTNFRDDLLLSARSIEMIRLLLAYGLHHPVIEYINERIKESLLTSEDIRLVISELGSPTTINLVLKYVAQPIWDIVELIIFAYEKTRNWDIVRSLLKYYRLPTRVGIAQLQAAGIPIHDISEKVDAINQILTPLQGRFSSNLSFIQSILGLATPDRYNLILQAIEEEQPFYDEYLIYRKLRNVVSVPPFPYGESVPSRTPEYVSGTTVGFNVGLHDYLLSISNPQIREMVREIVVQHFNQLEYSNFVDLYNFLISLS